VTSCKISPNSTYVVSVSTDHTLTVWDLPSGAERATLFGHTDQITGFAISPDCSLVVSTSKDLTAKIWDVNSGKEISNLEGYTGVCAFSPNGRFVLMGGAEGTLRILEIATGKEVVAFKDRAGVGGGYFSPDGKWIFTTEADKSLKCLEVSTGEEQASLPLVNRGTCLAVSPNEPAAVCGDSEGKLYFINLIGIQYGPLIVTATQHNHTLNIRCPVCRQASDIDPDQLDKVIICPQQACEAHLRLNPFVIPT
jgi:WD40 repeat protein